jgi:hypothetical protein
MNAVAPSWSTAADSAARSVSGTRNTALRRNFPSASLAVRPMPSPARTRRPPIVSTSVSNQERLGERRKHWGELIARQQQSGKAVKAFCEETGVGGPSFYAWRKRLKGKIQPVGFDLVAVGQQRGQAMELILSSGERLQIGPGVDLARLKQVLSALREPR